MDHTQLIQGFSDQTKVADAHFLVSVVELTPFLSISVCWFWFWLSQTRKRSPEEMGLLVLKRRLSWELLVKQNLPFWSVKSFWNSFSCLGNPLLQVKFAIFFLSHIHQGQQQNCFLPPAEIIRNFLAFWKLYFSSQKQSQLVTFGWKFNSDYKNNVLATWYHSFGYCNIAGK